MARKKTEWGDIPNLSVVKNKDINGKWIRCKICDIKIKVRCQFSFTEWQMHTDGVRHNKLVDYNSTELKNVPKLTTFFTKRTRENTDSLTKSTALPKKRPKIIS